MSAGRYLDGEAAIAAQQWLRRSSLPDALETVDEMIECWYPGGLHWWVTQQCAGTSPEEGPL